jgi:hypothetical protein
MSELIVVIKIFLIVDDQVMLTIVVKITRVCIVNVSNQQSSLKLKKRDLD